MNTPLVFFLNTYGAFLLFLGIIFYLWIFVKAKKELLQVISATVVTVLIVYFLKFLFDAPRPYLLDGQMPTAGFFSGNHSFPSFHAALIFTVATSVALHQKKLGIVLLLLASLVAFGRVVAHVHYPADVAGGAILGTLIALFVDKVGVDS
jgi:undecaprenyl-diphosphatase